MEAYMNDNYNLRFTISPEMKTYILSEYSKIYNQFEPFAKWMNDPDVDKKEKDKYEQNFLNAMRSLSFFYDFLIRCNIDKKEIQEHEKIPF